MKINIYNLKSEVVGEMSLPKLFETVVSEKLINQAIKVYTNNQRKSHAKAKDRGDIAGTTKKMWAQKGTGRARHSTTKASQFTGGGIAHGPQGNQNYKLRLPKAQRTLAIHAILAKFAKQKRIIVIDQFKDMSPKTKDAIKLITCLEKENAVLSKSHKIGIITNKTVISVKRAFRNIPGVKLLCAKSLNAYNLANQNYLFFSKKAINDLK